MTRKFVTEKVESIPYSGIRRFFDIAAEMKDAVSLGVGEPDFFTPWHVREEAIYSLESRRTTYTSNAGMPALRSAVSGYIHELTGLRYRPKSQVLVTVGVSEAIDIAMRAILDPGDEVLIIEPCYVSYRACVLLAGGVPVSVPVKAENNFRITPEDIEPLITPKTKAVLFCYPNNPTGAIMEKADWERVVPLFVRHDLLVISDEVYAELTFAGAGHFSPASLPGMYERTLMMNGFSKSYAMTGWRLGYVCGPEEIIAAMVKIHQYVIMCAPTMAQYAGIEALQNGRAGVIKMRQDYDGRRRYLLQGFKDIGLPCFEPLGAFYTFPSVAHTRLTSEEFCTQLIMEEKLAVVPGGAFGENGEGHVRCCYAYSIAELKEALARLGRFMKKFKG